MFIPRGEYSGQVRPDPEVGYHFLSLHPIYQRVAQLQVCIKDFH